MGAQENTGRINGIFSNQPAVRQVRAQQEVIIRSTKRLENGTTPQISLIIKFHEDYWNNIISNQAELSRLTNMTLNETRDRLRRDMSYQDVCVISMMITRAGFAILKRAKRTPTPYPIAVMDDDIGYYPEQVGADDIRQAMLLALDTFGENEMTVRWEECRKEYHATFHALFHDEQCTDLLPDMLFLRSYAQIFRRRKREPFLEIMDETFGD